jgi:hypothetical protein
MMLPRLYFSRPAVVIPGAAVDNDAVLSRVRDSFRGSAAEWEVVDQSIPGVFDRCDTKLRYFEPDLTLSPGGFASRASAACLQENAVAVSDVDLVIYRHQHSPEKFDLDPERIRGDLGFVYDALQDSDQTR